MAIRFGMIALAGACLLSHAAFAAETPAAGTKKPTVAELKAFQHSHGLKETGVKNAATKKAIAAEKDKCKGKGGTLDFSDPCNSALLAAI